MPVVADSTQNKTDDLSKNNEKYAMRLANAGIRGDRQQLRRLADDFDNDELTLDLLTAYLKRWYAGRLNGLESIPVLLDNKEQGRGLRRLLAAFELKLRNTSDLNLLNLLSLSDRPVPQQHMKAVFRSTLMERWLTRRDDYVRFLGPLGRLNEEHWHWVVENLRRLHLLEQPLAGQQDLLFVAAPIRYYFSEKLRLRNRVVYEQGHADMQKLFQDTVVEFRQRYYSTPAIKTWISPELQAQLDSAAEADAKAAEAAQQLEAERLKPEPETTLIPKPEPILWRNEELEAAQQQLKALRSSLGDLKKQTARLSASLNQRVKPQKTTIDLS